MNTYVPLRASRYNDATSGCPFKDLGGSKLTTLELIQVPSLFNHYDGALEAQAYILKELVEAMGEDFEPVPEEDIFDLQRRSYLACEKALEGGVSESWIRGALWDRALSVWTTENDRVAYVEDLSRWVHRSTATSSLPKTEMGVVERLRRERVASARQRRRYNPMSFVYQLWGQVLKFKHAPRTDRERRRRDRRIAAYQLQKSRVCR